jgi:hypothetical protein
MRETKSVIDACGEVGAELALLYDIKWIPKSEPTLPMNQDMASVSQANWLALHLVPPHQWYAEQIGWQSGVGKPSWWKAICEPWKMDRTLQEHADRIPTPNFAYARMQQFRYPFINANGQPQRVRVSSVFWLEPFSSNPEIAPSPDYDWDHQRVRTQITPEAAQARWQFRISPTDGTLLGVLRNWVSGIEQHGANGLWEELEDGALRKRWLQFLEADVLRRDTLKRRYLAEAEDEARICKILQEYDDVPSTFGDSWQINDLRWIAARLAVASLPHDLRTAAYAKLRLLEYSSEDIPSDLRPEYGGFVDSAVIKNADNSSCMSIPLSSNYNWGHDSAWQNKIGGILNKHAKWVESHQGALIEGREIRTSRVSSKTVGAGNSIKSKTRQDRYQRYLDGKLTLIGWTEEQLKEEIDSAKNLGKPAPTLDQILKNVKQYCQYQNKKNTVKN